MNRSAFLRFVAAATLLAVGGVSPRPARADEVVPGHVLVRVRPGVRVEALARSYNARVYDWVPGTDLYCLYVPRGAEALFARWMSRDRRVLYTELDQVLDTPEVSGNPFTWGFGRSFGRTAYALQAAYPQAGINFLADGQVNPGSVLSRVRGAGVIVAVVDTGVALDHPDLQGRIVDGYNAIAPGSAPWDVPDGNTGRIAGHGTAIAGIIARLAPEARILPIRVLNGDGRGTLMNVARGVEYAIARKARVINMSWGLNQRSRALEDSLSRAERAGIFLVASAGNENATRAHLPAADRRVFAVASVEASNRKSPFSNYGSFVRVVAPGSGIRSTDWMGGYATWSGTSFAAPFVSAQAALLLSARPRLRPGEVRDLICDTARSVDRQNPRYRGRLGDGIIDIEGSINVMD